MSEIFDAYAAYYDLLYRDKDYAGEAAYVHGLLQQHAPGAYSVLELGCGTGGHAEALVALGYQVTGVDMSQSMLARADVRVRGIDASSRPRFLHADLRDFRAHDCFDVVLSLFHVFSYQVSNEDLRRALLTAATHLRPGGLLVFDFWYGPGVLSDPPAVRVRRMEGDGFRVTRITEPTLRAETNMVDVEFEVFVEHAGGFARLRESHRMRYLFGPELDLMLEMAGLQREALLTWQEAGTPGCADWYACVVARKGAEDA